MNRDELLDTIQRLIALSSSANEHESAIALARANELMAKHNISMVEIEANGNAKVSANYKDGEVYTAGRSNMKDPFICSILQEYFFVKAIYTPGPQGSRRQTLRFFGDETNVQIAKYVYSVLDLLFGAFADANRIPAKSRRIYYQGLSHGYKERLKEERASLRRDNKSANALVCLDRALVEAFQNKFPSVKAKSMSAMRHDANAYNQGVADGKKINVRQGLAGTVQPKLSN